MPLPVSVTPPLPSIGPLIVRLLAGGCAECRVAGQMQRRTDGMAARQHGNCRPIAALQGQAAAAPWAMV